ncbi:MAG: hypothetical protein WDO13_01165 [Verrucomicrobiota bacterium]
MREYLPWKPAFLIAGLLVAVPVRGQSTPPPTSDQVAQLDQIEGVGRLKFGAPLDSFDPATLKPAGRLLAPEWGTRSFTDADLKGITWGGLQPTQIELEFCFGQLWSITLRFSGDNGALLAVGEALTQKYGSPPYATDSLSFANGSQEPAHVWTGHKIQLKAVLPEGIPVSADAAFLTQKFDGAVQITDMALWNQLTTEKLQELKKKVLDAHDVEKIKGDL